MNKYQEELDKKRKELPEMIRQKIIDEEEKSKKNIRESIALYKQLDFILENQEHLSKREIICEIKKIFNEFKLERR